MKELGYVGGYGEIILFGGLIVGAYPHLYYLIVFAIFSIINLFAEKEKRLLWLDILSIILCVLAVIF